MVLVTMTAKNPRMSAAHSNGMSWDAHAHISDVHFHQGVVIGEADPFATGIPDMNVGPAAQRTRRERRGQVAGIEFRCNARLRYVDDHALAMA